MELTDEPLRALSCDIQLRPVDAAGIEQLLPFVQKRRIDGNAVTVFFSTKAKDILRSFVEAERLCCTSLIWEIIEDGNEIVLKVNGGNQGQASVVFAWFED
jgi:hypothetical protein